MASNKVSLTWRTRKQKAAPDVLQAPHQAQNMFQTLWIFYEPWAESAPVILKCVLKKFKRPLNFFNLLSKTNLNHNTKFPEAQVEFYAKGDYGNVQGKFAALSEWGHSEEEYGVVVRARPYW